MYMVDTNIWVDFLRGRLSYGLQLMKSSEPTLFKVPAIVEAELLHGAEKSKRPEYNRFCVEKLLSPFDIVPFCSKCAHAYGKLRTDLERNGACIGPNDLLIAATALVHGATLVTNNVNEFKCVSGLSLESWGEEDF